MVDLGSGGSGEVVQTVPSTVDDTGLIREGAHPIKAHSPDVRSATTKFAHFKVLQAVKHVLKLTDKRLPGVTAEELAESVDRITVCGGHSVPFVSHVYDRTLRLYQGERLLTMNAVTNVSLLHITLGLSGTHRRRMEIWATWSTEQRRQALVSIRTGIKTSLVENELSGNTGMLAFRPFSEFSPTKFKPLSGASRRQWEFVYDTLVSIGAGYGLLPNDFQYYCTIPSPKGSGHRVFYPFRILSRPQALAIGWDWHILNILARKKLQIMRKFCNRHAEGAGYGEPQVTELVFIYWMAHHFSSKIQQVRADRPQATRTEVAFHILDRWGLPLVP
ncbi:hypothetical protein Neosp_003899 [[Neocosmospora] mangrovei]